MESENNENNLLSQGSSDAPVAGVHGGIVPAAVMSSSCEGHAEVFGASAFVEMDIATSELLETALEPQAVHSEVVQLQDSREPCKERKSGISKRPWVADSESSTETGTESVAGEKRPLKQRIKTGKQMSRGCSGATRVTRSGALLGHSTLTECDISAQSITDTEYETPGGMEQKNESNCDKGAKPNRVPPFTDRYVDIAIARKQQKANVIKSVGKAGLSKGTRRTLRSISEELGLDKAMKEKSTRELIDTIKNSAIKVIEKCYVCKNIQGQVMREFYGVALTIEKAAAAVDERSAAGGEDEWLLSELTRIRDENHKLKQRIDELERAMRTSQRPARAGPRISSSSASPGSPAMAGEKPEKPGSALKGTCERDVVARAPIRRKPIVGEPHSTGDHRVTQYAAAEGQAANAVSNRWHVGEEVILDKVAAIVSGKLAEFRREILGGWANGTEGTGSWPGWRKVVSHSWQ